MPLTCHFALRLNVTLEVGFDKGHPLFDTAFNVTSTIPNIACNLRHHSALDPNVHYRWVRSTHFFGLDRHRRPHRQISSYLTNPKHVYRTMQRYLLILIHEENIWWYSSVDVGETRKSRSVYPLDAFRAVNTAISTGKWGKVRPHPALRSCNLSTKISKSIELGESKSYSFL